MEKSKFLMSRSGFTILELTVTMAIAGVIAFAALPSASGILDEYHLVTAANRIGFEVVRARAQAVAQGTPVRLSVQQGSQNVVLNVERYNTTTAQWAIVGGTSSLSSGIAVNTADTVEFGRSGLATSATSITISNHSGSKTITVNRLGRVDIS